MQGCALKSGGGCRRVAAMRKCHVMRAALACLLGAAGGAPGREIPVYREYTVPISFAAEPGERTVADAAAPDLAALRSIRDVQAREALMGKDTLLGLSFIGGSSAFGKRSPVPGKMAPPTGGDDGRRSKKNDTGQNWLVKSMQLPALGQTASNTATTVLSADENESGWGWLVDEVTKSSGDAVSQEEEMLSEADASNPFLRERAAALAQAGNAEALPNNSFPNELAVQDRHSPNRNALSGSEPVRPGGSGQALADFSAPKDYRVSSSAAGGMSQTRELIAGFSGGARPDFTSLRESLAGAAAGPSDGEEVVQSNLGSDLASSENRSSDDSGGVPTRSGAGASWQGGWSASSVEASVLPRLETPTSSTIPASTPVSSARPGFSSGGYKPAWY